MRCEVPVLALGAGTEAVRQEEAMATENVIALA